MSVTAYASGDNVCAYEHLEPKQGFPSNRRKRDERH